jgi:hypothetical protein
MYTYITRRINNNEQHNKTEEYSNTQKEYSNTENNTVTHRMYHDIEE